MPMPAAPRRPSKSARRTHAAAPWPGTHECSCWTLPGPHAMKLQFRPLGTGIPYTSQTATSQFKAPNRKIYPAMDSRSAAEQVGRDLLAGLDQALHRADRLVERL